MRTLQNKYSMPLFVTLLAFNGNVEAQNDIGPLRTYAASPYQSTSLSTQLRSAFPVELVEFFAFTSASSVWAHSEDFELDYYQNQVFTGMNWRINEKLSGEVMYQFSWANNNGLDSFVMNFHDAFGFSQNGREEAGEDQFSIVSDRYGVSEAEFEDEVLANAMHLYLQYQVYERDNEALAIGTSVYFNDVEDDSFASGSFETGLQVNYSKHMDKHALFTTVGLTYRNDATVLNSIEVHGVTAAFAVGYSYQFTERHEVLSEYHIYQGVLDDDSEFSKPSQEFVLGYRYHYDWFALELSATENLINMDNSTDILFTAGFRFFMSQI